MGLVLIQHIADHAIIDQDRLQRSRGRENQFGARIGLPFQYSRTYTVGKDKTISNIIYLRFLKGFGSLQITKEIITEHSNLHFSTYQ